ncbi:MAG: hexokinase, partial [Peptococcaceae bacterium]|nr:hexokinase [Peptococcaceae bacterium]
MRQAETPEKTGLGDALCKLDQLFKVTGQDLRGIAGRFHQAMLDGLAGAEGPLKMLPSFISTPSGLEKGRFFAVDFGGTNVRILLVELLGNGRSSILKRKSMPLKDPAASYDFTQATATGSELFDLLAGQIKGLAVPGEVCALGHTFSFPSRSYDINKAVLINWTKEIKTGQVEGRDINQLLAEALRRQGLPGVIPAAVINDTVGTLLAAAYSDPGADIGSICGTGHNTCYLEPRPACGRGPVIINLESGNFNLLSFNVYDQLLDQASEKPGEQRLEKMVSGRYLGGLTRLVVRDLVRQGLLLKGSKSDPDGLLQQPYSIGAELVALALSDDSPGIARLGGWLAENLGVKEPQPGELAAIRHIAGLVASRSARLIAATYLGILRHLDPALRDRHT